MHHKCSPGRCVSSALFSKAEIWEIEVPRLVRRRGEDRNGRAVRDCDGSIQRYWTFTGKRTCGTWLRLGNLLIWRATAGGYRRTAFAGRAVTETLADLATHDG